MGKKKEEGFEQHLEALERIVDDLESGDLTLEESMKRYEDGVKRLKECYGLLRKAEQKVRILVQGADGELSEEPFSEDREA
jgi:exodeoxyribonuclease VII small subunit